MQPATRYPNKVMSMEDALSPLLSGMRLMLGEFVGAGEPACAIEALLAGGCPMQPAAPTR